MERPVRRFSATTVLTFVFVLGSGAIVGVCAAASPRYAPYLVVGGVCAVALGRSVHVRAAFVVLGGIFILQSSSGVGGVKVAYLAGVAVCVAIAIVRYTARSEMRPLMAASVIAAVLVSASSTQALVSGSSPGNWTRGAATYLLLTAAPVLAVDFARAGAVYIERLFVFAASLSVVSFTAQWSAAHGLAILPVAKFTLSSYTLAVGLFVYAAAKWLLETRHRAGWLIVTGLVAGALFLTGARTALTMIVAPLAMAVSPAARRSRRQSQAAVVGLGVVMLVAVAVVVGSGASSQASPVARAAARISSIFTSSDQSAQGSIATRQIETDLGLRAFESSPLLGVGLGHVWVYQLPYATSLGYGTTVSAVTLDSVTELPAELGIVGTCALLVFVWQVWRFAWRLGSNVGALCILGEVAIVALYAATTNPFDEKGLALTLTLFLAIAVARQEEGGHTPTVVRRARPSRRYDVPSNE